MSLDPGTVLLAFLCIVVAVQIAYHIIFFRRLAFHQAPPVGDRPDLPVSVVVCTRDEARNLSERLPAVLEQEYAAPLEVVVVNDNSVDDTSYLLEDLQVKYSRLKPVDLKQEAVHIPGKKFPLAVGIKTARHDAVLLTDADCSPASPHWVSRMQSAYREGIDIVLGYGGYERRPGLLNRLIRFETFHTALQYLSFALAGIPYMGVGRNLSYRRELFFRYKGFSSHNHIPGGDDDLFINMAATDRNTAVMLDPESFTLSEPKTTFRDWKRQKLRHYSTGRHYKPRHKLLLGLYAASHLLLYPLLAACLLLADWRYAAGLFGLRLLVQGIIFRKTMLRLGEADLWPWFWLLDLWQWLYYLIFIRAPWMAPRPGWK
jgi:glycosyltransferase involved in cell wall biosynthesis